MGGPYDAQRLEIMAAQMLYNLTVKHKEVAKFRVFDYKSLKDAGMDLFGIFILVGIYRIYGYSCHYYL